MYANLKRLFVDNRKKKKKKYVYMGVTDDG